MDVPQVDCLCRRDDTGRWPSPCWDLRPHSSVAHQREAVLLGAGPGTLLQSLTRSSRSASRAQRLPHGSFGRLRRTLATAMDLVFGDGPTAEAAVRRLNRVHAGVRGPTEGEAAELTGAGAYRALDPALLLWVQVTLIVTSVKAYRRWVGEVTDAEADAFWQEARSVGVRMGIPSARARRLGALSTTGSGCWRLRTGQVRPRASDGPADRAASPAHRAGWAVRRAGAAGLGPATPRPRGLRIPWRDGRERLAGLWRRSTCWTRCVPPRGERCLRLAPRSDGPVRSCTRWERVDDRPYVRTSHPQEPISA